MDILRQVAAGDAFHDSAERYPQPKCHPETRSQLLETLREWSSTNDPCSRVLWLHGPAGAGKSVIAQSFCKNLEAEGRLGASFFFRRGHPSRGNGNKLFSTIAYQLAVLIPEFAETVEKDPTVLDRSISLQAQRLILEPSQQAIRGRPLVVVIDGLDECKHHNVQQEILRSLGDVIQKPVPLRFLVASRPEPHIREIFGSPGVNGFHLAVNINQSFDDVRRYFVAEFTRIHREHHETMAMVPPPWPSREVVETLVQKSSGYFIYASTVIKFVDDKDFRPTERLDIVMGSASSEPGDESPFLALDQLYIQILSQTRPAARPRLLRILAAIFSKLGLQIRHIEQLLELKRGDIRLAFRSLHSVLEAPKEADFQIHFHHASFGDFLSNPAHSGEFYVNPVRYHAYLTGQILKAFTYVYGNPSLNHIRAMAW
ncbi:hypothetical protein DFH07DRAFT_743774 [Mycena maculata]|uniref:NACHT domain-containing protein n=1 Tax=Mycena maculata TaxID=230809 RepID=A0AAD7J0T4_9AGAR|nr:hypothetical protein DFH07DRAFT_743774 [Mycena maculata]